MTKHLYLAALLLITVSCTSSHLNIPDADFKNALINTDCIDTDGDGKADSDADLNDDKEIQLSEVENLEFLDVSSKGIKSLEGIQHFVNLKALDCYKNKLSALDVTQNIKLETLFCFDNQITDLDMSHNPELYELGCRGNNLTSLDLSQNKKLGIVYCYKNNLTSLNIKNGNNAKLTSMWAFENPDLSCIEVDDSSIEFPTCDRKDYSGWCKDSMAVYNNTCI